MKVNYIFLLIFFSANLARCQSLQRQTISNEGVSNLTKDGFFYCHTIGQSISSQTFKNSTLIVQQGFQQSLVSNLKFDIYDSKFLIKSKVYPNPFFSFINVDFSAEIIGKIQVKLIDMAGKVVFTSSTKSISNSISINNLEFLPAGSYVLILNAINLKYENHLIKN